MFYSSLIYFLVLLFILSFFHIIIIISKLFSVEITIRKQNNHFIGLEHDELKKLYRRERIIIFLDVELHIQSKN